MNQSAKGFCSRDHRVSFFFQTRNKPVLVPRWFPWAAGIFAISLGCLELWMNVSIVSGRFVKFS